MKKRGVRVREALSVMGSLEEESADRIEETVRQIRSTWRRSSTSAPSNPQMEAGGEAP